MQQPGAGLGASRPGMFPGNEPSRAIPRGHPPAWGDPECHGWRASSGVPGELLGSSLHHAARTVLSCLRCCLRCCRRPDSWGQGREGPSATSPRAPRRAGWWGQGSWEQSPATPGTPPTPGTKPGTPPTPGTRPGTPPTPGSTPGAGGKQSSQTPPQKHPVPLAVTRSPPGVTGGSGAPGFEVGSPHLPIQPLRGPGMHPGLGFPAPYAHPRGLEPTQPPRSLGNPEVPQGGGCKSQLLPVLTRSFFNKRLFATHFSPTKTPNEGSSEHEICITKRIPSA